MALHRGFLFASSLTAALVLGGCAEGPERDVRPEGTADGKEIYYFKDVETMTATSRLVVKGHVTAVGAGRWIGPPRGEGEGGDRDQMRQVTLAVDEVLSSQVGTVPATITVEEGYWTADGTGVQFADVTWTEVGHLGYYFLTPVPEGGYRLISSQGRVSLKQGDAKSLTAADLVPTAASGTEIFGQIDALTESGLAAKIKKADRDRKDGKIKPLAS